MNKKGQSEIITSILIILLVLAAVVIVWQVVNSTVSKGATQANAASNCVGMTLSITKVTSSGVSPNGIISNVIVRRGADSLNLNSIRVIISNAAGTAVCSSPLTWSTGLPLSVNEQTYAIAGCTGLTTAAGPYTVSIAPNINANQCDIAASIPVTF